MPTKSKYSAAILAFVSIFGAAPALAAWPDSSVVSLSNGNYVSISAATSTPNELGEIVFAVSCFDASDQYIACDSFAEQVGANAYLLDGDGAFLSGTPDQWTALFGQSGFSAYVFSRSACLSESATVYANVFVDGVAVESFSDSFDISLVDCPPTVEPPAVTTTQIDLLNPDELQGVIIAACFLVTLTIALWPQSER